MPAAYIFQMRLLPHLQSQLCCIGAAARVTSAQQPDDQLEGSSLLEDSDFSSLITTSEAGGRGFGQSGFLPSNEAFNFPDVPMDLYSPGMPQGARK